jgi:hypothetical protein
VCELIVPIHKHLSIFSMGRSSLVTHCVDISMHLTLSLFATLPYTGTATNIEGLGSPGDSWSLRLQLPSKDVSQMFLTKFWTLLVQELLVCPNMVHFLRNVYHTKFEVSQWCC